MKRVIASTAVMGALLGAAACSRSRLHVVPLPPLPAEQVSPRAAVVQPVAGAPSDSVVAEPRVSLDAVNADVRAVLIALAQQAKINVVMDQQVKGRVTVSLHDVPVSQALRAVMDDAGLHVAGANAIKPPWPPVVVFYQLPVNIDSLGIEAIQKRFGVSREVAELIVRARAVERP